MGSFNQTSAGIKTINDAAKTISAQMGEMAAITHESAALPRIIYLPNNVRCAAHDASGMMFTIQLYKWKVLGIMESQESSRCFGRMDPDACIASCAHQNKRV